MTVTIANDPDDPSLDDKARLKILFHQLYLIEDFSAKMIIDTGDANVTLHIENCVWDVTFIRMNVETVSISNSQIMYQSFVVIASYFNFDKVQAKNTRSVCEELITSDLLLEEFSLDPLKCETKDLMLTYSS